MHKLDILKKAYFFLIWFLVFIIVLTPYLVRGGTALFSEEFLEGIIIFSLLMIGWVINFFYERETEKQEKTLQEAWKHIGAVNLLVDRFRLALTDDMPYPRSKKELQVFSAAMLEKIRGVVPCEFLLLRLVEAETLKTVFEYSDTNLQENGQMLKIGNKDLVRGKKLDTLEVIGSQSDAINMRAFIIFPAADIGEDRKIVIQKIVNDFVMVYAISTYIL